MRTKKLRGHKRIWKDIEEWRKANLPLDLEEVQARQRDYVKIYVSPFCDYSLLNSEYPQPKGKTRELILTGLLDIYDSWKMELDKLGEPYYLKLWLYQERFSNSQVVCAVGKALDFYEITFHQPKVQKKIDLNQYGDLEERMKDFEWDYALDEVHLSSREIGVPEDFISTEEYELNKRWIDKQRKKPHRKTNSQDEGEKVEYYSFKRGTVWLGQK